MLVMCSKIRKITLTPILEILEMMDSDSGTLSLIFIKNTMSYF